MRFWRVAAGVALAASAAGCPSEEQERAPDTCAKVEGGAKIVELVASPPAGVAPTWDNFAGKFVSAYCVGCHNPQVAGCSGAHCHAKGDPIIMDFRDRTQVEARAEVIRCGISLTQEASWNCGKTEPNIFPKGNPTCTNPFPASSQRELMIQWLSAGTP